MNKKLVRKLLTELVENHKAYNQLAKVVEKETGCSICSSDDRVHILEHDARDLAQTLGCEVTEVPRGDGSYRCGFDLDGIRVFWLEGWED